MNNEYDYLFKVILIGDIEVGKTCLLLRFVEDTFSNKKSNIGLDYKSRTISVDDEDVRLHVYDSEGKINTITSSVYGDVHGIILVYDVTEEDTFDNLKQWLEEIKRYASKNVNKMLVGNKADLIKQKFVDYGSAKELADELRMPFFETSAKNGNKVDEAFMTLATEIKKRIELEGPAAMALAERGGRNDKGKEENKGILPDCPVS